MSVQEDLLNGILYYVEDLLNRVEQGEIVITLDSKNPRVEVDEIFPATAARKRPVVVSDNKDAEIKAAIGNLREHLPVLRTGNITVEVDNGPRRIAINKKRAF